MSVSVPTGNSNVNRASRFTPYEIPGKPWGTETVIAKTDAYMGKVLIMRAGQSGPLQYHERKDETFYLWAGKAEVTTNIGDKLVKRPMHAGESCHIPPGEVHRVKAVTTCVFFEVGNAVLDDRVNVEDRFREDPDF